MTQLTFFNVILLSPRPLFWLFLVIIALHILIAIINSNISFKICLSIDYLVFQSWVNISSRVEISHIIEMFFQLGIPSWNFNPGWNLPYNRPLSLMSSTLFFLRTNFDIRLSNNWRNFSAEKLIPGNKCAVFCWVIVVGLTARNMC